MKLHHIRNVVAIVERGSLRAAARHLGLAQPVISRSLRELEEELGLTLFERSRLGMTQTKAGELFVRRAKAIQAEFQRTFDELDQYRGVDRGTIVVACSGAAMLRLLPAALQHFRRRFPDIRVKVIEGTFAMLEADIRDGLVDLYFGPVTKGEHHSALSIKPLMKNPRIVVGRRDHPLRLATTLEELVGAEWVSTPIELDIDNEVNCVFRDAGLPLPNIMMQATSCMSLVTLVTTSDLLAPLPEQWIDFINTSNLLVQIPVAGLPDAPQICSVYHTNSPLTPAAQFMNDMAEHSALEFTEANGNPIS
jgi:DNA-binding transcriptional LysR family regulator